MLGSKILEVAIGIIFIYLLVSIICSAVREALEGWFKTRSAYLEIGIRELLHDKNAEGLAKHFFNHPLIYSLFSGDYKPAVVSKRPSMLADGRNLPSYIPSKNFATALMDIAARGPDTDSVSSDPGSPVLSLASIRMNLLNLKNTSVQRAMLIAIDSAQGDINKAQANIEAWYESGMDRISGWYKRSTSWIIFWIGLTVAIVFNVNTITIADYLYRNDAVRSTLVARAEAAAKDSNFVNQGYFAAKRGLDSLNLPIGWSQGWGAPRRQTEIGADGVWNNALAPFLGWLITALAATLGAPFWFDLLNKVMVIRSTVKPHEKSKEEASEDRQHSKDGTNITIEQKGGGTTNQPIVPSLAYTLEKLPSPRDDDSDKDGCDVVVETISTDEELPASEGGVEN